VQGKDVSRRHPTSTGRLAGLRGIREGSKKPLSRRARLKKGGESPNRSSRLGIEGEELGALYKRAVVKRLQARPKEEGGKGWGVHHEEKKEVGIAMFPFTDVKARRGLFFKFDLEAAYMRSKMILSTILTSQNPLLRGEKGKTRPEYPFLLHAAQKRER